MRITVQTIALCVLLFFVCPSSCAQAKLSRRLLNVPLRQQRSPDRGLVEAMLLANREHDALSRISLRLRLARREIFRGNDEEDIFVRVW